MKSKLLVALLTTISVSAYANPPSQATQKLEYRGEVDKMCAFQSPKNGSFSYGGNKLSSLVNAASIEVANNAPGAFQVSVTRITSFDQAPAGLDNNGTFTLIPSVSGVNAGAQWRTQGNLIKAPLTNAGADTLSLGLVYDQTSQLPSGGYLASTVVSCIADGPGNGN